MPRSLRTRLVGLVAVAVVPSIILISVTTWLRRGEEVVAARQHAAQIAALVTHQYDRIFENARVLLLALTRLPEVSAVPGAGCGTLLATLLEHYPQYANLAVSNAEGHVVCAAKPTTHDNVAGAHWFQRIKDGETFAGSRCRLNGDGHLVLRFGYPIQRDRGPIAGVVFASMNVDWLRQRTDASVLPDGASLLVSDDEGCVLVRQPNEHQWIGRSLPETLPLARALAAGQRWVDSPGVDGVPRLYALDSVDAGIAVRVAIGISESQALGAVNRNFARNLGGMCLVGLLALGVAWVGGERLVVAPARALLNATQRVRAGDLSARAGVSTEAREFEELGQAFDAMTAKLEQRDRERDEAQDAVRRLNEELERRVAARTAALELANQELEAFSSSVSHDLRAPLRHIEGFGRILREQFQDTLPPEARRHLDHIVHATDQMGHLIEGLLKLARVARQERRIVPMDLTHLAQDIDRAHRAEAPARQVTFACPPGLTAKGDPDLLRSLLENLLDNAWKYTAKQAQATIEFGVQERDGERVYFVRDDGAGFDMTYAGKLFQPFQRLHRVEEFPGTGIGLATVRRIVQRHGGRIWAEGAEGQGATFFFTLSMSESEESS